MKRSPTCVILGLVIIFLASTVQPLSITISSAIRFNWPLSGSVSISVMCLDTSTIPTPKGKSHGTGHAAIVWLSTSTILLKPAGGGVQNRLCNAFSITAGVSVTGDTLRSFASVDRPQLSSAAPLNLPQLQGSIMTIFGQHFGTSSATPAVRLGPSAAANSLWVSDSSIFVRPIGGFGNLIRTVISQGILFDTPGTFFRAPTTTIRLLTFDAAVPVGTLSIQNMYPTNNPGTGSTHVSILGNGFGLSDPSPVAFIGLPGATACVSTRWVATTNLQCKLGGRAVVGRVSSCIAVSLAQILRSQQVAGIIQVTDGNGVTSSQPGNITTYTFTKGRVFTSTNSSDPVEPSLPPFSFNEPTPRIPFPTNTPGSGAESVTILGLNFALSPLSPKIRLVSTSVTNTLWISESNIMGKLGSNIGVRFSVSVSVILVGTRLLAIPLVFDEASVTRVFPRNAPLTGSVSLSLRGGNFGDENILVSTRFGYSSELAHLWRSQSSVAVKIGPGTSVGPAGFPTVLVTGLLVARGTLSAQFTYIAPNIRGLFSPAQRNGPTSGSTVVTVVGNFFGLEDASPRAAIGGHLADDGSTFNVTYTSTTLVGGVNVTINLTETRRMFSLLRNPISVSGCQNSNWISESTLLCKTAAGSRRPQNITATLAAASSFPLSEIFTFNTPFVTRSTNAPLTGDNSLFVSGSSFNLENASPAVRFVTACTVSAWQADSTLNCKTPSAAVGTPRIIVTMLSLKVTSGASVSLDLPKPIFLSRTNMGRTGADTVLILGSNFGEYDPTEKVRIGLTTCEDVRWFIGTASIVLRVKTSAGSAAALATQVSIQRRRANPSLSFSFSYDTRVIGRSLISSARQSNSVLTGGVFIWSQSVNLGGVNPSMSVQMGGTVCESSTWTSDTGVGCPRIAKGISINKVTAASVRPQLLTISNSITFDKIFPLCFASKIVPATIQYVECEKDKGMATTGNVQISLTAFAIGETDYTNRGRVGGSSCLLSVWVSDTSTKCKVSRGLFGRRRVVVTSAIRVGEIISFYAPGQSTPNEFSYTIPTIRHLGVVVSYYDDFGNINFTAIEKERSNGPGTGMTFLTLSGVGFGNLPFTLGSRLGETSCSVSNWVADSSLACKLTAGANNRRNAVATAGVKQLGCLTRCFTYDEPELFFIGIPNSPTSGSLIITLNGRSFGPGTRAHIDQNQIPLARLGGTNCKLSLWLSDTTLRCMTPTGSGSKYRASVTVGKLLESIFSYQNFTTPDGNVTVTQTLIGTFPRNFKTLTNCISYNFPNVIAAPNGATTGSVTITLSVSNSDIFDPTVSSRIGISHCLGETWSSHSSVRCKISHGQGRRLTAVLSVKNLVGNLVHAFSTTGPSIFSLHVNSTFPAATGAFSATISGGCFGHPIGGSLGGRTGATSFAATTWISDSGILGHVPSGYDRGRVKIVSLLSLLSSLTLSVSYQNTNLLAARNGTTFFGFNGALTGGSSLTLSGIHFGPADTSAIERLQKTCVAGVRWNSDSATLCKVPRGLKRFLGTILTARARNTTHTQIFSYDTFLRSAVSPVNSPRTPPTGAFSLTLVSLDFGIDDFTLRYRVSKTCPEGGVWRADTSLSIKSPVVFVPTVDLAVTYYSKTYIDANTTIWNVNASSLSLTLQSVLSYTLGFFNNLTPANGPYTGGTSVTLATNFFGSSDSTAKVRISPNVFCAELPPTFPSNGSSSPGPLYLGLDGLCHKFSFQNSNWTSTSSVKAKIPRASLKNHAVLLSLVFHSNSLTRAFSYSDTPDTNGCIPEVTCSNRGACGSSGVCLCFLGQYGEDCSASPTPMFPIATPVIDVKGGVLKTPQGDMVNVPPQALKGPVTMWITVFTRDVLGLNSTTYASRSNVVECGPQGQIFEVETPLTLTYASEGVQDPEQTLTIAFYDPQNREWTPIGGIADPRANTITVNIKHFTRYMVLEDITSLPGPFTTGVIIGIVFGAVALLISIVACVQFGVRRPIPEPVVQVMADGSSVGFMQGFETAEQFHLPKSGDNAAKTPALNVPTNLEAVEKADEDLDDLNNGVDPGGFVGTGGRTMVEIQRELYNPQPYWDDVKGVWRVK